MIRDFHIVAYKMFSAFELSGLKRVNLFAGENNFGKSSLLEALLLAYGPANGFFTPDFLSSVLHLRHGEFSDFRNLSDKEKLGAFRRLFPHDDIGSRKIEFATNGASVKWSLDYFEEQQTGDVVQRRRVSAPTEASSPMIELFSSAAKTALLFPVGILGNQTGTIAKSKGESGFPNINLLTNSTFSSGAASELWDKIVMTDLEEKVLASLSLIMPKVERLAFISGEGAKVRVPVVKIAGTSEPVPLKVFGDGVNRILCIALAMAQCRNGVFLLDEYENGLHYRVQDRLWKFLFNLAKEWNVQLFVTTHSSDAIREFCKNAADFDDDCAFFRLDRAEANERISVISYSPDELRQAMEFLIEVR